MKQLNRSMRVLFIAAFLVNAASCKAKSAAGANDLEITVQDFITKYGANEKIQVLDVRTPEEYSEGHVPKAVSVPLDKLTSGSVAAPFEKDSEIYVICRSGKRSMAATEYLKGQGYTNVKSVAGGTMAWTANHQPVDK